MDYTIADPIELERTIDELPKFKLQLKDLDTSCPYAAMPVTCKLCDCIPIDPQECDKCEEIFCLLCWQAYQKDHKQVEHRSPCAKPCPDYHQVCVPKPVNRFVKKWVINNLEFRHRCEDVSKADAKIHKKVRKMMGWDSHNLLTDSEIKENKGVFDAKDDELAVQILKRRLTETQACFEKLKQEEASRLEKAEKVKSPEKRMSKRQQKLADKQAEEKAQIMLEEKSCSDKITYRYLEMIEHLKICPDVKPTFECPKCPPNQAKKFSETELRHHLESECQYMLVSCARCHRNPVQRRDFSASNDHSDAQCISILKDKIKCRDLKIKEKQDELKNTTSRNQAFNIFSRFANNPSGSIPNPYDVFVGEDEEGEQEGRMSTIRRSRIFAQEREYQEALARRQRDQADRARRIDSARRAPRRGDPQERQERFRSMFLGAEASRVIRRPGANPFSGSVITSNFPMNLEPLGNAGRLLLEESEIRGARERRERLVRVTDLNNLPRPNRSIERIEERNRSSLVAGVANQERPPAGTFNHGADRSITVSVRLGNEGREPQVTTVINEADDIGGPIQDEPPIQAAEVQESSEAIPAQAVDAPADPELQASAVEQIAPENANDE